MRERSDAGSTSHRPKAWGHFQRWEGQAASQEQITHCYRHLSVYWAVVAEMKVNVELVHPVHLPAGLS